MHCKFDRLSLTTFTLLLLVLWPAAAFAQDELLTEAPTEYRIFGIATDDQGQPISGATASLVTLPTESFGFRDLIIKAPPATTVTCEQDGSFDLRVAATDKRWNAVNKRTEHLLVVHSPGHEISITRFKRPRLLINLPAEVTLKKCEPWQLKVTDQDGQPVSDMELRLAQINTNRLPHKLDVLQQAKSVGDGLFQIEGVTRGSLTGVFLSGKDKGSFLLPVSSADDEPVVQLPATGTVNGNFELLDSADLVKLTGVQALITGGTFYQRTIDVPPTLSWAIVPLDDKASATSNHISAGAIAFGLLDHNSVSFSPSLKDYTTPPTLTPGTSPVEITQKLYPTRNIVLRFESESGEPINTVHSSAFGGSQGNESVEGEFILRVPEGQKPSGQLFPFDASTEYQISSNFGVMLDRLKSENDEFKPIAMTRSRSLKGTVTDESGNIVAGAKIEYTLKSERFTLTESTLADSSGNFRIDGLPPNTNVTLAASKGALGTPTDANISAKSGSTEPVTIPVVTRTMVAMVGKVTDQQGNPLAGAKVKLYRAVATQAEGYQGEDLAAVDLIPEHTGSVTGPTGEFRYPPTAQFEERIQVSVTAPGFRDQQFPFIDGRSKEIGEQSIQLGSFPLFKLPIGKQSSVTVVDKATGKPVEGAKLVFVGIDITKQVAATDSQGTASLNLKDTNQLLAVKAPGYQLHLSSFKTVPDTIEVSLESQPDPQPLPWLASNWKDFHEPTAGLLKQLEVPLPKESTFYRQNTFFKSQLNTDFAAFQKAMLTGGYEHQQSILMFNAGEVFQHAPRESYAILATAPLPAQQKAMLMAQFALITQDESFKEELYGEAIVQAGESAGAQRLMAFGRIAQFLVIDGQVDVAKELISETWESETELREVVESKQAKTKIAESRVFAPLLGLVDADAAIQLTRLTAREMESPGLVAQCLAYASIAGDQDIEAICKKHNVTFEATGLAEPITSVSTYNGRYEMVAQWIQDNVDVMPDSTVKVGDIFFAARHLPANEKRAELIRKAAAARKSCNPSYHWNDPAKRILEELPKFDSLTTTEFDELLFAAIEHAPPKTNSMQLNGVYANLIKLVAVRDPAAASGLLEPAFENGAWLYGDPTWSAFSENSLLKAWAWINPKLAAEKAIQLSDRYAGEDPVRKLELLTTVINELNTIAIGKGMLQGGK